MAPVGEVAGAWRLAAVPSAQGAVEAGVGVGADVVPGPAVEAVFLDGGDVVGDEVVAEVVALVDGAPELAGDGVDGLADAVADAGGVDLEELAFGGELEDVGAVEFLGGGVGVVDVGAGADGDEHLCSVGGEDYVAGPVAAAAQLGEAGELGDDFFGGAGGYEVAGFVGEADDGVGVADVDPLGVGAGGVEVDAEGEVEALGGEGGDGLGLAVGAYAAEDEDFVAVGVGEEDVAVGGGAEEARLAEGGRRGRDAGGLIILRGGGGDHLEVAAGVEGHLEAGRGDGPGVGRFGDEGGAVVDGFLRRGRGEIGDGDFAAGAGGLLVPVGEGCGAGYSGLGDGGKGG